MSCTIMFRRGFAVALLVAASLLAVGPARAAIFYVSTSGSDANPGTEAQPWRTIQKGLNTAGPGDTVRVRAGTYVQDGDCSEYCGLRFIADRVVLEGYPGERPVLDQRGAWIAGIINFGHDFVTVRNFEITGASEAGIWTESNVSNMVIEDVYVHDIAGKGGNNVAGLRLNACVDCAARRVLIHNITENGVFRGSSGVISYDGTNVLIENADIHHVGFAIFHKRSSGRKGLIVRKSVMHDVGNRCANYSISGTGNPPHVNQEFYENLCYAANEGIWAGDHATSLQSSGLDVHNNILEVQSFGIVLTNYGGVRIYNNLIKCSSCSDGNVAARGGAVGFATLDYNIYYGVQKWILNLFNEGGAQQTYTTLSSWTAATGHDSHSANTDPLFVPGTYQLQANSPARNAGRSDGTPGGAVVDVGITNGPIPPTDRPTPPRNLSVR